MAKPAVGIALAAFLLTDLGKNESAQKLQRSADAAQQVPESKNDYVGLTKCSACHFKQYESWKESGHAKTFDALPAKYRSSSECLECHAGRHGRLALQQDPAANVNILSGVACEDCHGPGREHANLALSYVLQTTELTDEAVTMLRAKIQRTALDQCIKCHLVQAHKEHPDFDREQPAPSRPGILNRPPNRRALQVH